MLGHDEVWRIVSKLPHLAKVWGQGYIAEDSKKGFLQPWLNRLAGDPDEEIISELTRLDSYLGMVTHYKGFNKLLPGLKAHDIEYFSSTVAEVKTDAWIASYNTLDGRQLFLPVNDNYFCRFTSFLFCSTALVR